MNDQSTQQSFVDLTPAIRDVPIGFCTFDLNFRYMFVNECLATLNGVSVAEHLGRTIHEVNPAAAAGIETQMRQVVETGETVVGAATEVQSPAFPGETRTFQHTHTAIRGSGNEIVGLSCLVSDVSQLRRAESAARRNIVDLEKSEERLNLSLDAASIGTWSWNLLDDGHFWDSRMLQISGVMPDDVTGIMADDFLRSLHPDDEAMVLEAIRRSLEEGAVYNVHYRIIRRDNGEVRDVNARALVTWDDAGKPIRMTGVAIDVTEQKRSERELASHRDHLSNLVAERTEELFKIADNLPVLITRIDAEQRYTFVNATAQRWYDQSADQILGKTLKDLHGEAIFKKFAPYIDQLRSGQPVQFSDRVPYADGVTRDVEITLVPDIDPDGTEKGHFGLAVDITERKMAERALRQSESRLRTIIDNYPWLITLKDLAGRYLLVNKSYRESRNMPVERAIGKTAAEIETIAQSAIVDAHDQEVIEKREMVIYERDVTDQDDARATRSVIKFPAYNADGELMGIGTISTDITMRKRAEEALRESETRFRAIFDQAAVGIGLMTPSGRFLSVNQKLCDLMGLGAEELLSLSFEEFTHPDDYAACLTQSARLLLGEIASFTIEMRYSHKKGVTLWCKLTTSIIRDPDNDRITLLGIVEDFTEAKHLDAQLRQSQKLEAVGQLTGGIAHDFNNMLSAIIGNLDLIEDGGGIMDDSDRESIAIASRAALRGAELTHRLLAFSRQQELDAEKTQINEILPKFCRLAERTIGEDITIKMKLATGLWPVMVDASQLENALLNLAINARDAMPDGGQLVIETDNNVLEDDDEVTFDDLAPGDYVMIAVSDNGAGMSAAVRERVFEPFFTTKDVGEGSGLGLSMVFGFAKQSGGQVSIYSEEGVGTTVKIYLPRAEERTWADITTEQSKKDWPTGSETILVVEDDNDVLGYLVTVLNRLGYTVLQAGDGPAALEVMAASDAIDLLLTDMILPRGMSGRNVAAAFRELYPAAGVLYSSGYTREVLNRRGGLDEGAALMNKPYQTTALAWRVREVLDGRK